MSEPCTKENELGKLQATVEMVKKEIFNGDNALSKSVPVLSMQVGELTEAVKDLRTVISGFKKFQDESTGGTTAVGKKNTVVHNKTVKTVMIVTAVISLVALVFTVFNNTYVRKINYQQQIQDLKMQFKADRAPDSTTRGGYVDYSALESDTLK